MKQLHRPITWTRAIQRFPSSPGFGRWSSYSKKGRCLKHWKLEKCRPWWYSPAASNTPHASSPACFLGVSLHGLIPQLRKIKKFQKLNPDLAGLVHKNLRLLFRSKSWFQCLAELFWEWNHLDPIAPSHLHSNPSIPVDYPVCTEPQIAHFIWENLAYVTMIQCCINLITPLLQSLAPVACNEALMLCLPRKCRESFRKWASIVLRKICSLVERKVCLIWYEYILYNKYIYAYIYIWSPPEDLPKSFFNCIYNIKCVLSYTKFPTIWVIPSNCRCHKTLKNTVYLYMPFSKLVRNHLLFVF